MKNIFLFALYIFTFSLIFFIGRFCTHSDNGKSYWNACRYIFIPYTRIYIANFDSRRYEMNKEATSFGHDPHPNAFQSLGLLLSLL